MITISQHQFMIEHYQSILFLSDTKIIIQTKNKKIEVDGKCLHINYYSSNEIRGAGDIICVRFV